MALMRRNITTMFAMAALVALSRAESHTPLHDPMLSKANPGATAVASATTERKEVVLKPGPFGEMLESEAVPPAFDEHGTPASLPEAVLGPVIYSEGPAVPCGAMHGNASALGPEGSAVSTERRLTGDSSSSNSYTITQTFSTSSSSSSCVCTSQYRNGYAYYYSSSSPVSYYYTDTLDSSYTVTGITVSMCGAPCGISLMTVTVAGISVGTDSTSYSCYCSTSDYMSFDDAKSLTTEEAASYKVGDTNQVVMTFNGNYALSAVAVTIEYTTASPTAAPTSTPQPTATPLPTSLPTLNPTMSSVPTSKPTPVPSPPPSPAPSPLPTMVPTTPMPTQECTDAGYGVSEDDGQCKECTPGKYDNTAATSHGCVWCSVGKFQSDYGKTSCDDCDEGKLSYADRTNCGACSAGQYAFNDTSCEDCTSGKYAPTAQEDDCLTCSEGFYTGVETAATNCEGCDGGKFSAEGSVNCTLCDEGTYSTSKSETCSDCEAGTVSSDVGQDSCTSCTPGYYQASTKQTECIACEAGTVAAANGATSCIECTSGTYAEAAASSCTKCDAGYYSNTTGGAGSCTQCTSGRYSTTASADCEICAAGKYATAGAASCSTCSSGTAAAEGASECDVCEAGFFSPEGSSACKACPAGNYNTQNRSASCEACPVGRYEALGAGTECDACKQGRIAATAGTTACSDCSSGTYALAESSACTKCDAGTYSEAASSNCTLCDEGKYSLGAASVCVVCEVGKKAPVKGQATRCDDCAGGTYQDKNGSTSCNNCTVGHYAVSTGASFCEACAPGQFADSIGQLYCKDCASSTLYGDDYTSGAGASECDQCIKGFYADNEYVGNYPDCDGTTNCAPTACITCPDGVACDSAGISIDTLILKPGWFRFTASSKDVRPCPFALNCVNVNETGEDICLKGAEGPLCQTCKDKFYYREAEAKCVTCVGSADWYIGPLVGVVLVLIGLIFLYTQKDRIIEFQQKHHHHIEAFSFRLAACFVTLQIIMLLQENRQAVGGKPIPRPYGSFISWLNFLALDIIQFLPFSCAYGRQMDHFDTLVINTVLPVVLFVVVIVVAYAFDMKEGRKGPITMLKRLGETSRQKSAREAAKAKKNRENAHKGRGLQEPKPTYVKTFTTYFIQAALLILPATSLRIAKSLRCDYFDCEDDGTTQKIMKGDTLTFDTCTMYDKPGYGFLSTDYAIDCMDTDLQSLDRYNAMAMYAGCMIFIYPIGIPLALYLSLYRIKDKLNPPGMLEHVAIKHRKDDFDGLLKKEPIAQFATHYRPHVWYYEVYALLRRLVLTSLALANPDLGSTTIFVLSISLITLVIEKETQPHVNPYLTAFTYVLHWQVILVILFTLLLDADMTRGWGAVLISVALLIVNIGMIMIVLFDTRETDKKVNQILHSLDRAKSDLRRSMLSEAIGVEELGVTIHEEDKEGEEDHDVEVMSSDGHNDQNAAEIHADDVHHVVDDKDVAISPKGSNTQTELFDDVHHVTDEKDVSISPSGGDNQTPFYDAPRPDGVEMKETSSTSLPAAKSRKPAPKATGRLKPPGKRAESRRELGTAPSEVGEVAIVVEEATL